MNMTLMSRKQPSSSAIPNVRFLQFRDKIINMDHVQFISKGGESPKFRIILELDGDCLSFEYADEAKRDKEFDTLGEILDAK